MSNNLLYYNKPAKHYMEALPLGNGSLGAMCYSSVGTDIISLNHDTLWTGHPVLSGKRVLMSHISKHKSLPLKVNTSRHRRKLKRISSSAGLRHTCFFVCVVFR